MQVGDDVIAIGNALGQFQNTVTSGILSGYGRSVQARDSSGQSAENLDNLFQTDAAINEGNSGGPLVNAAGQVVGMNTAIAGNAQNIGFAIPINDVKGLIEQVLDTGKFARPYLGVHYVSLTADIATQYDLSRQQGAFVYPSQDPSNPSVVIDSPAAKAGVKENDIIIAVNGESVDSTHSLTSRLAQYKPGDTVKLTVVRGKETVQLTATLSELPANTSQ
jgi:S1-C subfamily serine protease